MIRTAQVLALTISLGAAPITAIAAPPLPGTAAETWTGEIPPTAVASYLREKDKRVLVVAAGPESAVLTQVGAATTTALRNSGQLELVMDASALGRVDQLSDQEIVGKAAASPVTAVVIVRVFGDGAQASVVGTSYALDGSVIAAFSISPGAVLSPRADTSDGSGISESTAGAISAVMEDHGSPTKRNDAELEYLERFLHFRHVVQFNVYTGQGTAIQTNQVRRGIDNVPLSDVEMLHYIGESSLARRHGARQKLKTGLVISGAVLGFAPLIGGAVIYGLARNESCLDNVALFSCEQNATLQSAGLAMIVVGSIFTTGFIVGAALPTIVKADEKTELINSYNRQLRRELLLPDDVEKRLLSSTDRRDRDNRRARMLATWRLAPTGPGLSFNGRF